MQSFLYTLLIINLTENIVSSKMINSKFELLFAGDIELNPGPGGGLKFFYGNLNSIRARNGAKIPLIEAYNSVHNYDISAVSESMLDETITIDNIFIGGFSNDIFRSDHPSNSKIGGVGLYYREGLPIIRRKDLEFIQEMVCAEITIARIKIVFCTVYRSPSQTTEQFEAFIDSLQILINRIRAERPYMFIFTADFNCRSSQL